jgi:TetR/AcrR family tetracycline transcriptional repressor
LSQVRVQLSREVVLAAAAAQAQEGGLDSVSSRTLAARLGVTPMALYRHVRDMDEIVAALVDGLLVTVGLPDPGLDWGEWLERAAWSLRDLFLEYPRALGLFNRQPVTTEAARARLGAAVGVLARSGFTAGDATRAYAAVHTYTIGFCSLEAGRRRAPASSESGDAPDDLGRVIRDFVTEEQFRFGLRALVAGLEPETANH